MSDKDSKLIFEAYSRNVFNEAIQTIPAILSGATVAAQVGLNALAIGAGYLGFTELQKTFQNVDLNFLKKTAPAQASLIETMNEAMKDFETISKSNNFDEIRPKAEQVALLFNDVPGQMNALFKNISSVILKSLNAFASTGEAHYIAAAGVAVGDGLVKTIRHISKNVIGLKELPDNAKNTMISSLNEMQSKASELTTLSQELLDSLKADSTPVTAPKVAPIPAGAPPLPTPPSPSPSPPPKQNKFKEFTKKQIKRVLKIDPIMFANLITIAKMMGAIPVYLLVGLIAFYAIAVVAYKSFGPVTSSIANTLINTFGGVEDLSVGIKTATQGAEDAITGADSAVRGSVGFFSGIGDTISKTYASITSLFGGESDGSDNESPDTQQQTSPENPADIFK